MADANQTYDPPLPIISGLTCRCPRCGKGKLFSGFLQMAPSCEACGLDFSFADPADGPAFFVMTAIGMIVIAVFTWVEVAYHPPMWVHMVTVFPALIIGCLGALRPVKAWLVASQFFHKAEEAQFSSLGGHGEGGFGLRGKARDRAA
ncbi:MAG: DUF983 domain-containing protein [Phenylobacterium sp.]|nr:DUF983 domain-containing protein [Phenylobacterium sp.]